MHALQDRGPRPRGLDLRLLALLLLALQAGVGLYQAVKLNSGLGSVRRWPAGQQVPAFEWVEQRTRGAREVGWIGLEGAPEGFDHELLAARLRHALTPTWILKVPAAITVVALGADRDPDRIRARLAGEGFDEVVFHRESTVALAFRGKAPPSRPRIPPTPPWRSAFAALLLLAVALVPALWCARGRGPRPFFLALLGAPYALAFAAALGDASPAPAPVTWLAYAALIAAWCRLVRGLGATAPVVAGKRFGLAAGALVAVALGTLVFRLGLAPEGMLDAVSMYNMRARAIVLDPGFLAPFHPVSGVHPLHPDYPPAIPFAVAGGYRLTGTLSVLVPMWVQVCLWAGALGLLCDWSARAAGRGTALTVLLLLGVLPHWQLRVSDQGCDVPLGLTFMAALAVWESARSSGGPGARAAWVTGLLMGAVIVTKDEGLLYLAAWLGSLALFEGRALLARPRVLIAFLLGIAPAAALNAAFALQAPPSEVVGRLALANADLARASTIAREFLAMVARVSTYAWVFPIAAAGVLVALGAVLRRGAPRTAPGPVSTTAATLVLVALGYFLVYLLVGYEVRWLLDTSCDRLFAQLFPAAVFLGAALAAGARAHRGEPIES